MTEINTGKKPGSRFGCAAAIIVCIITAAVIVMLILPHLSRTSSSPKQAACRSNIRQISNALRIYEDEHRKLPESLKDLQTSGIVTDPNLFMCPFSKDNTRPSYVLLYPGKTRPADIVPILVCREQHPGTVTSADGETGKGFTFTVMSDYSIREIPVGETDTSRGSESEK